MMNFVSKPRHQITRHRHELKRRALRVVDTAMVTPRMKRIVFHSADLHDFDSPAPDDHVKLFFPDPQGGATLVMRDYTPRWWNAARGLIAIDFALHAHGVATTWAKDAREGDTLTMGGPKGSLIVADDFDWYLLVGDETALPAILRRVETLRPGVPVASFIAVDTHEDIQRVPTMADHRPHWLFRTDAADDATRLLTALSDWQEPPGEGYVFIAAEAAAARAVKRHMLEERGHNPAFLKAAGYWVAGEAGAAEKM